MQHHIFLQLHPAEPAMQLANVGLFSCRSLMMPEHCEAIFSIIAVSCGTQDAHSHFANYMP